MRYAVWLILACLAPMLGCELDVSVDESFEAVSIDAPSDDFSNDDTPSNDAPSLDNVEPVEQGSSPPVLAVAIDHDENLISPSDSNALGTTVEQHNPSERENIWTRKNGVDWPSFLGPTGDSVSPEKGILTQWPKAGPRIVWQRELEEGYGIGSISKGRMFQFDRHKDLARLTCMNAETGQTLWIFQYETDYSDLYGYNAGPRCSPVIDEDRVTIYGAEGMLHCLRVSDGKLLWKVDVNKSYGVVQNFFGVGSTPAIHGDLLIVMVGGSPAESQSVAPGQLDRVVGHGSGIVAFDKRTGKERYRISNELASYSSVKLATIGQRRWGFVFARGGLVGFEPGSGKVDFHYRWRADMMESVNASAPVVVGNQVFISECYSVGSSLLEVSPGEVKVVWKDDPKKREKAMLAHWNTPVYRDGYLYGCSGRNTPEADLRCVDWKTGQVKWRQPRITRCSLLHVDGHFLCLTEYGMLLLLRENPEKFDLVATATLLERPEGRQAPEGDSLTLLQYPCWAAPILSHGLLYVRGARRLVCLELIAQGD